MGQREVLTVQFAVVSVRLRVLSAFFQQADSTARLNYQIALGGGPAKNLSSNFRSLKK